MRGKPCRRPLGVDLRLPGRGAQLGEERMHGVRLFGVWIAKSPSSPVRTPASVSRSRRACSLTDSRSATRRHSTTRPPKATLATLQGEIAWVYGDLSDPSVPERLVSETVDKLGSIDVLVNNAGIVDCKAVPRPHGRRLRPHVRRRRARELPARTGRSEAHGERRLDRQHHLRARAHPAARTSRCTPPQRLRSA